MKNHSNKMTLWQHIRHYLHLCPRALAGYPCSGAPGRCGWELEAKLKKGDK